MVELERDAAEDVAERRLEGEGEDAADDRARGDDGPGLHPVAPQDRNRAEDVAGADDEVRHDGGRVDLERGEGEIEDGEAGQVDDRVDLEELRPDMDAVRPVLRVAGGERRGDCPEDQVDEKRNERPADAPPLARGEAVDEPGEEHDPPAERDERPALGEVLPERGEAGGGVIGRVEGRGERGQHQHAKVTRP